VSDAAETVLTCNGVRHTKHYDEKADVSFLAQVDSADKTIVLKTPTTISHYDMQSKIWTSRPKVEITRLKIYDEKDGFLFVEKEGKVSDSDMVMNRRKSVFNDLPIVGGLFNSTYVIEIQKDDYARGIFDPYSGRLTVETRYYKTRGSQYEYGWSLTADCRKTQSLF
jgi:hypothetical protein